MTNSNAKGDRRERELRNIFRELDGAVPLRVPASGSGIDMDLPDVLVGWDGQTMPEAIEAKAIARGETIYVPDWKALVRFSEAFGTKARVYCRWDQDTTWYYDDVENIPRTDEGSLRIKPEWAWENFNELYRPPSV